VSSYGSEARFHVPLFQQFGKSIPEEDLSLIRDDVFRYPMFLDGSFQRVDDPSSVGAFQGSDAHDLVGEMVNGR
jgi:hypothetical protein